ncbi:MAG: SDR family oxidoreductase [Pseudohongiella sp.]|nr:SDR family oxidoreductase [Pseudohongiella sp.]
MRVLVLGANGMLGHAVFRLFARSSDCDVFGSMRSAKGLGFLPPELHNRVFTAVDVENSNDMTRLFASVRPDVVINCVGLIKQLPVSGDPLSAISINALLPHWLAQLSSVAGARLIQIGTDCVFSGSKGGYKESDPSDAQDLYGRSKFLGEVDYAHAVTLRTSIIGHELEGTNSLLEWFLAQTGSVKGYRKAIFSGLTTPELARVIRDHVVPRADLHGVYHVSAAPISKYDLLTLVAEVYGKTIDIQSDDQVVIDRSLDSTRFKEATGYRDPAWPDMIRGMKDFESEK